MSGDFFIDSNIWLYAFMDESSPKHAPAKVLIERNRVVLSTQVINEVCNNLIRKAGYTEPEIQQTIQNWVAVYPILDVTLPIPALRATPPYPRRGKIHNSFRKPISAP